MKYIIKNCPAYDYDEEFNYHICKQPLVPYECSVDDCQNCPDCVIKQIVELCKIYKNMNATTTEDYAKREVALKILQLLEIEEVNE